jgi:hypothetical protein
MFAIDATPHSCVMVCDCGWRDVARDRLAGWRLAAAHERAAHPGQLQASHNAGQARRAP